VALTTGPQREATEPHARVLAWDFSTLQLPARGGTEFHWQGHQRKRRGGKLADFPLPGVSHNSPGSGKRGNSKHRTGWINAGRLGELRSNGGPA